MILLRYNPHTRYAAIADETKLVWTICLSVLILLIGRISHQVLIMFVLLSLSLYGDLRVKYIINYLKLFLPIILFIFLLHLFYHDGEELFKIWVLTATDTGLRSGIINIFRFINFIIVAISFFSFTSPLAISIKLATFFGLVRSRFFQELALVFFIALRFLPVLVRERTDIMLAMRARGANFKTGAVQRVRNNVKMLLPLLSRTINQTDDVAAALALKGDGNTYFVPERVSLKLIDYVLIIIGICLTAGVIYYA